MGYLITGYIAMILAPIAMFWRGLMKEIIQELPPYEDEEFSERSRK
jgi:hypothetical protein